MLSTVLTTLVFLSQILVISIYAPNRRDRFYGELLRRHPPREYPHLYPGGTQHWERRGTILKLLHYPIAVGGLLLLGYGLADPASAAEMSELLLFYVLVQILPWFLSMYWDARGTRDFRAMERPSSRSASLVVRKLDALVAPWAIYLIVLVYVCVAVVAVYGALSQALEWGQVGGVMIYTCLLLVLVYWHYHKLLRSPRDDPYESDGDYWTGARRTMRVFMSAVALAGVILLVTLVLQMVDGPPGSDIGGAIVASIILQLVFIIENRWLWSQLERKDYSVYRLAGNE